MSWASDCAERWVGQGNLEEEAINGAITETLVEVLYRLSKARDLAEHQGGFTYETVAMVLGRVADSIRALMVNPSNTPPANDG